MTASRPNIALPTLLLLAALASAGAPAAAVDIWVTRYDDPVPGDCLPTDCTLREAIRAVNGTDNQVNRIFLSAGTYELGFGGSDDDSFAGDFDLRADHIEIHGAGANLTTIDGNGVDRIFDLDDDLGPAVYLLQGLKITYGQNLAAQHAAAIRLVRSDLTLRDCEVVNNNDLNAGDASAIHVSTFAHLRVENSTIANNTGHGIRVSQASLTLENATLSGNSGREIEASALADVAIRNSTIFGVDALELTIGNDDFPLEITNSVVVGGCTLTSGATVTSGGGNVESPGHSCTFGTGDVEDVPSILLGSLALNGGSTRTHLPQISSAVVGAAVDATSLPLDQRGATRPAVHCDSGAVEWTVFRPGTPLFRDGFGQGDAEAWSNF